MPLSKFLPGADAPSHAKRERRKEARPGELLDAALDLFVEKGFAATRAEEVAARAGVSKGTLFLYFPSKEELLKAVVRENIAGRFSEWNAEFEAFQGSAADALRLLMRLWWERVGATKASGITKIMLGEGHNFPDIAAYYQQEVIQPGQALIRRVFERGVERGEFRPLDADYAIYSVIAPMIFLIMARHSGNGCLPTGAALDPERYIAAQVEIILNGICMPPESDNKKKDSRA